MGCKCEGTATLIKVKGSPPSCDDGSQPVCRGHGGGQGGGRRGPCADGSRPTCDGEHPVCKDGSQFPCRGRSQWPPRCRVWSQPVLTGPCLAEGGARPLGSYIGYDRNWIIWPEQELELEFLFSYTGTHSCSGSYNIALVVP